MLENGMEKEEIILALLNDYDADEATVRADTEEFLEKLKSYGIIEFS